MSKTIFRRRCLKAAHLARRKWGAEGGNGVFKQTRTYNARAEMAVFFRANQRAHV
jgi:hypothetical protein